MTKETVHAQLEWNQISTTSTWMIQAAMRMNSWQNMIFNITFRLDDGRGCSDFLNACKQQMERSLWTVSVISWAACQKSESEHLGARRVAGFVHDSSSNRIRLGCLKRVLPEKPFSDTGEIIKAAFEAIHPGRGNTYTEYAIIKKNILKRPHWKYTYSRLQYSQKTSKRLSRVQRAIVLDQHIKDIVWACDDKLHGFCASWDFLQISGRISLPNYHAWQGICNYICMFRGRICSISLCRCWCPCTFSNKKLAIIVKNCILLSGQNLNL